MSLSFLSNYYSLSSKIVFYWSFSVIWISRYLTLSNRTKSYSGQSLVYNKEINSFMDMSWYMAGIRLLMAFAIAVLNCIEVKPAKRMSPDPPTPQSNTIFHRSATNNLIWWTRLRSSVIHTMRDKTLRKRETKQSHCTA